MWANFTIHSKYENADVFRRLRIPSVRLHLTASRIIDRRVEKAEKSRQLRRVHVLQC